MAGQRRAQAPESEPRLRCRQHAVLLASAILGIASARYSSAQAPIALAFACYGALHGAAVTFCLRPRPALVRQLAFVAAASLLSGSLARAGLLAAPLLARSGVEMAALVVVVVSAFTGALGYGALLRCLLHYRLAPAPLVMIALACVFAASAALVLIRHYPAGGSASLAILWWLAFSGGLCSAAGRRARSAHRSADATKQRMA
jgi:hypothetical protein